MNLSNVKQLADLLEKSALATLTYEDADFKLTLTKPGEAAAVANTAALPSALSGKTAPASEANPARHAQAREEGAGRVTVKSPVVGTAYRAREPGGKPIVSVGDKVRKGDALCIVEAMKVFNEITSPCDGEIADIPLKDGLLAQFGDALVVIAEEKGNRL